LPSLSSTAVDARRSLSRWPASAAVSLDPCSPVARPAFSAETMGPPRFLGNPLCVPAVLSDPGRAQCAWPVRSARVLPALVLSTLASSMRSFRGSITRPSLSLSTPR